LGSRLEESNMGGHVAYNEVDESTGITLQIMNDGDGGAWEPADDEAIIFAVLHNRYINPAKGAQSRANVPDITDGEGQDAHTRSPDFNDSDDLRAFAEQHCGEGKDWEAFPLFLFDHGNTVYRVTAGGGNPFSCPWDSGQVGFLFVHKPDVGPSPLEAASSFCETYTHWANGNIWGYVVEGPDGEQLDSCWGFIGDSDDSHIMSEARESFASHVEEAKDAAEQEELRAAAERLRIESDVRTVRAFLESFLPWDGEKDPARVALETFNRLFPEG
jgi:hypothetical protein